MAQPFRHRIRVRFNECDGQGVVFYANYLMYFDVAMTELWREAFEGGYAGMIAEGTDAMVAEAKVRYLRGPIKRFDRRSHALAGRGRALTRPWPAVTWISMPRRHCTLVIGFDQWQGRPMRHRPATGRR